MNRKLHKTMSVLLAMGIFASSVPAYAWEMERSTHEWIQTSEDTQGTAEQADVQKAAVQLEQEDRAWNFRPNMRYETPELISAVYAEGGAQITWKAVPDAAEYRVYRRSGTQAWTELADVTETVYTDSTIQAGTVYEYTVAVLSNGEVMSSYDEDGVSFCRLAAPTLSAVSNSADGVKISWGSVQNAQGYRIYRKVSGGSWTELGTADGTGYIDQTAESGKTYAYTVSALYDGVIASDYDQTGLQTTYYAVPELSSVARKNSGTQITWKAVTGAKEYRVYRKTEDGNWGRIKDVTGTSYVDTTAKTGIIYSYTVRVIKDGNTVSAYDTTGLSYGWLSTPKLTSITNGTGVKISWGAVSKAEKYRVYRKTGDSGWSRIGETTGTSYHDQTVSSGKTYTYTVRAMYDGEVRSDYNTTGLKSRYYSIPELSAVSNTASGIKVTWQKVSGAAQYRVYRKSGSGSWGRIKDVTSTSYTDTTAKSGQSYTYTVRVLYNGTTASGYDTTGLSAQFLSVPTLSTANSSKNGIKVVWKAVSGAEEYRVYRKTGSSGWSLLDEVTGTNYTDEAVAASTNYIYTVRAKDGSAVSSYDSDGITARFLSATDISVAKGSAGVSVRWDKVAGATGYYVYRKYEDEDWKKLGKTTSLLYADESSFPKNGTYYYTVRAYYGSSLGYYSNSAAPGVEIKLDTAEVNRRLNQVMKTYPDGKSLGSGYSFAGASQCMGFAREVYYRVFDEVARWDYAGNPKSSEDKGKFTKVASTASLSASKVRAVVNQAKPGDVLQLEGPKAHSMIYLSRDEDGFKVYDANWSGPNQVDVRYVSYGSYASRNSDSLSLLHANNYPGE